MAEGVELSGKQKTHLLPHFFMIVIGKPGSGKTTLVEKLLGDKKFYYKKFTHILLMSPSADKMSINLKPSHVRKDFDLDWLFQHISSFDRQQRVANSFGDRDIMIKKSKNRIGLGDQLLHTIFNGPTIKSNLNPFSMPDQFRIKPKLYGKSRKRDQKEREKDLARGSIYESGFMDSLLLSESLGNKDYREWSNQQHTLQNLKEGLQRLQDQDRHKQARKGGGVSRMNVLVVMDDVVGQIKRSEYDHRISQLFFNRRHLIHGGTISLMLVSQKYTMIPARIRSQASWLALFKLNPMDFETVFRDAVLLDRVRWDYLVGNVFGSDSKGRQMHHSFDDKQYNFLGIWVEKDKYFKNFEPLSVDKITKQEEGENDMQQQQTDQLLKQ